MQRSRTAPFLPGVTRRSIIELLRDWGYEVVEGKLAIDTVMAAAKEGKLEEVFRLRHGRGGLSCQAVGL